MRLAAAVIVFLASLPVGGYGLLYFGAISTSDSDTTSLVMVGGLLLSIAALLIAASVWLVRGSWRRSSEP